MHQAATGKLTRELIRPVQFASLLLFTWCGGLNGQDQQIDFVSQIRPIFEKHCYECHSEANDESGLNLAIGARALAGGDSGQVIEPGKAHKSLLIELVSGADDDRRMPPDGPQLTDAQVQLLKSWINQGAKWPKSADISNTRLIRARHHWAFQPIQPIDVPGNDRWKQWCRNPIDQFVIRSLAGVDLTPNPPADGPTLCRRIHFDLIGLPPTIEQVREFDRRYRRDANAAVNELVDQLLARREYGERWARHWLDVVRYADSNGQEADVDRPNAYRYRDFVIRSFNRDQPYDEFVRWQLAGDELDPENPEAIVATGFLTAGTCTILKDSFLEEERLRNRYNELDDILSTFGNGILGLTIGCARCHDHKYDAVSTEDYYSLLGIFDSGNRTDGRTPDGKPGYFFRDAGRERRKSWVFERGDFMKRKKPAPFGFVSVLTDKVAPDEYWKQARSANRIKTGHPTSYQRKALAAWVTDTENGPGVLVARVIVNRIWHHHFGRGIVTTTSDFGVRGDRPSHPELLEWLTADFIQHGWRIKRLHRLILQSSTYRMSTRVDAKKTKRDPANRFLWRRQPVRLEAEILRDAILTVSGRLNAKPFGPGFKPHIQPEAIVARNLKEGGYPRNAKDTKETMRRSIYMFHKRLVPYPLLQAFDRPDLLQACSRRINTTVAPQALALLNDPFVRARAIDFADRLIREDGLDVNRQVRSGFEIGLSRAPTDIELDAAIRFVRSQVRKRKPESGKEADRLALADFCQALFGLNEFIYID